MTPELELHTTFVLDAHGRIRCTREPHASRGPLFCLIRSRTAHAWPVRDGVETAAEFRGRGFATRVVAGWARAVQASGRVPLYSADWANAASRGVARKLGLTAYASLWNVAGRR